MKLKMGNNSLNSLLAHSSMFDRQDHALLALGRLLKAEGYGFTAITPATHARVNARPENQIGSTLEDVFGWSRPFPKGSISPPVIGLLQDSDALIEENGLCRSAVRFSSLGPLLLMHSAFPTLEEDAVFFGPDTYRFARAISDAVQGFNGRTGLHVADIGSGSGAGGLHAASLLGARISGLLLGDINGRALRYSAINASLNNCPGAHVAMSDVLRDIAGEFDLVIANPPYLVDPAARLYRHGGGAFGCDLSLRIVAEALPRLAPGGVLLLYTGAPVRQGIDLFRQAVTPLLANMSFVYQEMDPDVFGEELDEPPYAETDRIAAVVLIVTRKIKSGMEAGDAS